MSTTDLVCLNSNFKVVSYNGGPICGQYGINAAFHVPLGESCRPTATRAGQTFDVILEYIHPTAESFTFAQLLVISPKFEEVTSMLKAGVVFVHDETSPFVTADQSSPVDYHKYSPYFNNFPDQPTQPPVKGIPTPVAMFNYPEKSQSTIAVADGSVMSRNGKYLHIKFTKSFDDDYNIDFGNFYIVGCHGQSAVDTPNAAPTYTNVLSNVDRSWLLSNGLLTIPTTLSPYNTLLTPSNQSDFFSQTSIAFISTKPIHAYLTYIEDPSCDRSRLSPHEQALISAYTAYAKATAVYTTLWRKYFTAELITHNLQQQTGTDMVKGTKRAQTSTPMTEKVLEFPQELHFFTIDPTTNADLRAVALSHLGEIQSINDKQAIVLSNPDALFSILSCSSSGACQRYQYVAQDHTAQHALLTESNEIAKKSLSPKVFEFITAINSVINTDLQLLQYLARFSLISNFLYDFYDQQEQILIKKSSPVPVANTSGMKKASTNSKAATTSKQPDPTYTTKQCAFFKGLLQPRILSQQTIADITANGIIHHPIYKKTQLTSYNALHEYLHKYMFDKELTRPQYYFVMPYDKTSDKHLDLMGMLFELSSLLNKHGQTNTQFGIFDVLYNNVNDCLFSFSKFLHSIRLYIIVPDKKDSDEQKVESAPATKTTTPAKKATSLGKVAPPVKKFTMPIANITQYIPTPENQTVKPNQVHSIDLLFNKMVDADMVQMAEDSGEETPPPTVLEFLNYLMKVQKFILTTFALPQSAALLPPQTNSAFGEDISTLDSLLTDISYLRMLHSTMIPSFFSRFIIQRDERILDEMSSKFEDIGLGATNDKPNSDPFDIKNEQLFVSFVKDSNDDKLFRALNNFSDRAVVLLKHLSAPVGTGEIHYSLPTMTNTIEGQLQLYNPSTIHTLIPNNDQDWDSEDAIDFIPQLMTLIDNNDDEKITSYNLADKIKKLRNGTNNTINLFNDRVRCMLELRDALLQIQKYVELFSNIVLNVIKQESNIQVKQHLITFFTLYQQIYHDVGLLYTLSLYNTKLSTTMEDIVRALGVTPKIMNVEKQPVFNYTELYNKENETPDNLYQATIKTADCIISNVSKLVQTEIATTFSNLSQSHNYVSLENETAFQRCLEGYVVLEPPVVKQKLAISRTAMNKTNTQNQLNNKIFDDAEDRIIVVWITHMLDGTYPHIKSLEATIKQFNDKYKSFNLEGDAADAKPLTQNIVLARIDVDVYPDIMETFGLEDPASSLPAVLFVQSSSERVDLRSTAVDPNEFVSLIQSSLIAMVENPELYGNIDREDDIDELLDDEDYDEQTLE